MNALRLVTTSQSILFLALGISAACGGDDPAPQTPPPDNGYVPPDGNANVSPTQLTVCPAAADGCQYVGGDGLQDAINAAQSATNVKVLMKSGTYRRQKTESYTSTEFGDGTAHKRKALWLISSGDFSLEGEGVVVLDGSTSALASGLVIVGGKVSARNFTVQGAKAEGVECKTIDAVTPCSTGANIVVRGSDNVTLTQLATMTADAYGLSINASANVTLDAVMVSANNQDGLLIGDSANAVIKNSAFNGNQQTGAFIANNSNVTVENATFNTNGEDGIRLADDAKLTLKSALMGLNRRNGVRLTERSIATLKGIRLYANTEQGLRTYGQSSASVSSGLFVDNGSNGAYAREFSKLAINQCTFYNNGITGVGGDRLLPNENVDITVTNSIIVQTRRNTDNTFGYAIGGTGFNDPNAALTPLKVNLVMAWQNAGDGDPCDVGANYCINITRMDPVFVNPGAKDFHLQPGVSPAINTADPAAKDPDGSRADLGAYGGSDACALDANLTGC